MLDQNADTRTTYAKAHTMRTTESHVRHESPPPMGPLLMNITPLLEVLQSKCFPEIQWSYHAIVILKVCFNPMSVFVWTPLPPLIHLRAQCLHHSSRGAALFRVCGLVTGLLSLSLSPSFLRSRSLAVRSGRTVASPENPRDIQGTY